MNKYKIIEKFLSIRDEGDVTIFTGDSVCECASNFDRVGSLYLMEDVAIAVGLGIAMGSNRRVFVVCEEGCFLRTLDSAIQAGVGACRNFFLIVLCNGCYNDEKSLPTILDRFHAVEGAMYNVGFISLNFTQYFKNKTSLKELKQLIERITGPIFAKVEVPITKYEGSNKYNELSGVDFRKRMETFISDESLDPIVYEPPPFSLPGDEQIGG